MMCLVLSTRLKKTISAVFLVITMIISGQGDDGVKIKLIWISSEDVRI